MLNLQAKSGFIRFPSGIFSQQGGESIVTEDWVESTTTGNGWTSFVADGTGGFTATSDGASVAVIPQDLVTSLGNKRSSYSFNVDTLSAGTLEFSLDSDGTVTQDSDDAGTIVSVTGGTRSGAKVLFTATGAKVVVIQTSSAPAALKPKFRYNEAGGNVVISGFSIDAIAEPEAIDYDIGYLSSVKAALSSKAIGGSGADYIQVNIGASLYTFSDAEIAAGDLVAQCVTDGAPAYVRTIYNRGSGYGSPLATSAGTSPAITQAGSPYTLLPDGITFDGSDDYWYNFATTEYVLASKITNIFWVSSHANDTDYHYLMNTVGGTGGYGIRVLPNTDPDPSIFSFFMQQSGGGVQSLWNYAGVPLMDGVPRVYRLQVDSRNNSVPEARLWVNGVEVTLTKALGPTNTYADTSGFSPHFGRYSNGDFFKHQGVFDSIIWADGQQSEENCQGIISKMASLHGITL